jgi:hypothetical protein
MKKETENPFPVSGYSGSDLFCDRVEETKKLLKNIENGINTTLFSIRRMGKTGLIYHLFNSLGKNRTICIYIDIYATRNLREFTNQFSSAVLKAFPERKSTGKKLIQFLKNLRPVISYDGLTGEPQVSFEFSQSKQYEHSLESIFSFLENQTPRIVIAFDEFQQITTYPEKNIEALLRSLIQPLKNVRFIFSGSHKHLLTEIFSQAKRPFFSSTQPLFLENIDRKIYLYFITEKFKSNKRKIDSEALDFIADWTRLHTFYTQVVCNRIFATGIKGISLSDVKEECDSLLKEQESIFFQYRNLLTSLQWNLLGAIASEDKVYKPQSREFIGKYNIGTSTNVQRTVEALMQKEMIYREEKERVSYYRVYDCFLARWLERKKQAD